MSGATHNLDQEFWRPPQGIPSLAQTAEAVEVCRHCGGEFVVGSRFCHVCGVQRESQSKSTESRYTLLHALDWARDSLGLTTGPLIAFLFALACVGFAIGAGLIYSADTVLDWQAIQLWRIQWLLGAATACLAGILLKRN